MAFAGLKKEKERKYRFLFTLVNYLWATILISIPCEEIGANIVAYLKEATQ
jgi:hypothetical protein